MPPPANSAMRIMAALMILFQVQLFVGVLLTAGYSLQTTLTAASVVAVLSAEITARLLGRESGSLPPPPQLPFGCC